MFLAPICDNSSGLALYDLASRRSWTHADLRAETAALAGTLAPARGRLALLFCRNTFGAVAAYLACVEAQCAVALLDASANPKLLADLIAFYSPELLIGLDDACPAPGYEPHPGPAPVRLLWRTAPAGPPVHEDLAVLLSTSGSTGSPKLVRLTRRNVEANADSIRLSLEIGPDEHAMACLPMHYSYGLSVLNSHLRAGASVVLTDESVLTSTFWETFRDQGCTSMPGVPYTYQMLARVGLDRMELPSLRTLTQAGGKLPEHLAMQFHASMQKRGGRFFVMYGQTEATARIACLPWDQLPEKLGAAGRAIPGGRLSIEPDPAAGEGRGEIVYAGPNVMMGYACSREDLSLGDELGGVLHTGDLGYLDPEGFLYVTGRSKRIAKLFGLRVNLDEIEARLRVGGPTAAVPGGDGVIIYCEYGDDAAFAALARGLASELRIHHSAFQFRRISALPLNTNGKVDYQKLSAT